MYYINFVPFNIVISIMMLKIKQQILHVQCIL